MARLLLLALFAASAAAFMVPAAPARNAVALTAAASSRSAVPAMHKPAGGGSPGKNKSRATSRRFINKAVFAADSKEKVEALFTSDNEAKLLKMNWRIRHHAKMKWKKLAAAYEVPVPEGFAAWNHRPLNAAPAKLSPSM